MRTTSQANGPGPTGLQSATPEAIGAAANVIDAGGLVAMPTETVYGLAADGTCDKAVARIFAAKGRPQFNPLILHVTGLAMAVKLADISAPARALIEAFWPGPLTLVLRQKTQSPVSRLATAGLETIALRQPDHPVAAALIAAVDRPLAAPSANPSGQISPTEACHVVAGLGDRVDLILDGGRCSVGVESTIVAVEADRLVLLRPGAIGESALATIAGLTVTRPETAAGAAPQAPGMLASHYAPHTPVILNCAEPQADAAHLAFGPVPNTHPDALTLSASRDPVEAAANLFAMLHHLDALCLEKGLRAITVAPIPVEDPAGNPAPLLLAIRDRLQRAAA